MVKDTIQFSGVVIVYFFRFGVFLFVPDPIQLGLSQCFWEQVTEVNKLMVFTGLHQVPQIGGKLDSGRNKFAWLSGLLPGSDGDLFAVWLVHFIDCVAPVVLLVGCARAVLPLRIRFSVSQYY